MCPPDSKIKYSVLYVYFCSCVIILCYFTGIFYADVRQISMLFIDNKDSVYIYICIKHRLLLLCTSILTHKITGRQRVCTEHTSKLELAVRRLLMQRSGGMGVNRARSCVKPKFNLFTVPGCKISKLKGAWTFPQTAYFSVL